MQTTCSTVMFTNGLLSRLFLNEVMALFFIKSIGQVHQTDQIFGFSCDRYQEARFLFSY